MSLLISKVVNSLLSANVNITSVVADRLFPLVADEDAPLPFIVYKRTSVKTEYTKDQNCGDEDTVQINVLSKDYGISVNLIQAVRTTLENFHGINSSVNVRSIRLDNANESCDGDVYVQELNFIIKTV